MIQLTRATQSYCGPGRLSRSDTQSKRWWKYIYFLKYYLLFLILKEMSCMLGDFRKRTWAIFPCVGFTLAPELKPAVALAWQFCRWHWIDSVSSEVHKMLLQLLSIQSQVPGESLRTDSPASRLSSSPRHLFKSGGYLIIRCCEHALY